MINGPSLTRLSRGEKKKSKYESRTTGDEIYPNVPELELGVGRKEALMVGWATKGLFASCLVILLVFFFWIVNPERIYLQGRM